MTCGTSQYTVHSQSSKNEQLTIRIITQFKLTHSHTLTILSLGACGSIGVGHLEHIPEEDV